MARPLVLGVAMLGLAAASPAAPAVPRFEPCRLSAGPSVSTVAAECATLSRPEDPSRPAGRQIELRVARVPARTAEPRPDPLVILAGGPGQAATDAYVQLRGAFDRIQRDRDVLLVDQRGTGGSRRLDCPEARELFEEDPDPEALAPAVARCLEELGDADPRFYTTSVAVEDLEAVRRALEIPSFNLYGVSYGTRVAQHFLRRYPASVRTMILDGVVPPPIALGPQLAVHAQASLDAHFARCASDEACRERFPNPAEQLEALLAEASGAPIEVRFSHPRTSREITKRYPRLELAGAVRLLSYGSATAALLPFMLSEAAEGRLGPLAAQVLLTEEQLEGSMAFGMHNAVVCTEDLPFVTREAAAAGAAADTYLGAIVFERLETLCAHWPRGVIDPDFHAPLESEVPTLLLSGELDPVTPPAWGVLAQAGLTRSLHLVAPGRGHVVAPHGCAPRLLSTFVDAASAEGLDADCLSRLRATPFFLDANGPVP